MSQPEQSALAEPQPVTLTRTEWSGFAQDEFAVDGVPSLVVHPPEALPGQPWIWRTQFFGAFPSVDLALLAKGFHLGFIDLPNLYGGPLALRRMDAFYAFVTRTFGLSARVVLEGFSRGGLYACNWASLDPRRVAAIYLDAPVCDFKSWPGGKGQAPGSPHDWEECKRVYGLTEEEAIAYPGNPVDRLQGLAEAGIPIIAVAGDSDDLVPMEENILLVEERYRKLGGEIELITKPGVGHHPHSLDDPAPVVDFLLRKIA